MEKKYFFSFLKKFASIAILFGISTNVFAQKDAGSITINGGIFSNAPFIFPNTKEHDFSVVGEKELRSVTMHNNIKSGKYMDDIMVSIVIPDRGVGEYEFTKEANPDKMYLAITLTHNLNDNVEYYHNLHAIKGIVKVTSVTTRSINGTFEVTCEEIDEADHAINYIVKGNFNAVKVN